MSYGSGPGCLWIRIQYVRVMLFLKTFLLTNCFPPLSSLANIPLTPETARDQERRIRREIANSNERRRMQSINSGFQSLKTLIPHSDGEKLSKVSKVGHGRGPIELGGYAHFTQQTRHRLLLVLLLSTPGCHPPTNGRVHFHVGAGEDASVAAEQPAQTNLTSKASKK